MAKVLIFRCKDDELTGPIIKTNRVKSQPNKEKKKVLVSQEKRNLQGHTEVKWLPQRVFYPRCPWEEPQRNSCSGKPWLLMKGFACRRGGGRRGREDSRLFFPAERQKAQEELRHGVWDISKYLTDFSVLKNLRPVTVPVGPPLTGPCHCLGPASSKEPLSVRRHHVMKLAVVAKQVSIKECEPRPRARRS